MWPPTISEGSYAYARLRTSFSGLLVPLESSEAGAATCNMQRLVWGTASRRNYGGVPGAADEACPGVPDAGPNGSPGARTGSQGGVPGAAKKACPGVPDAAAPPGSGAACEVPGV
mmetsp:Transcript_75229/g.195651  ORF Transcript_75229/g.195651 Transcript_75229/m.195651 type:complete len:115 (+) Transcript_75229:385-729(+)